MTVVFIDAKNAVYRFGWTGRGLTDDQGHSTGAIYGLLNCLLSFRHKFPNAKFVVCWDGDCRRNWRSVVFPAYKQSRQERVLTAEQQKQNDDLYWQMSTLRSLFALMGIQQAHDPDMEADDLVSILAQQVQDDGGKAVVYSSDQDYLQLVARGITVLASTSQPPFNEKTIRLKFRCGTRDVLKVRALLGDKSDGIPRAVSGVGEVGAAKFVAMGVNPAYKCFDRHEQVVRLHAPRLEQHWDAVHMNYRLMRLPQSCLDVEIPVPVQKRLTLMARRVMTQLTVKHERSRADYADFIARLTRLGLLTALGNRAELWAVQN